MSLTTNGKNVAKGVKGWITLPVSERFWQKVNKTDTCWLWTAGTAGGYGRFAITPENIVQAHRWAYEVLIGPIPTGLQLDHLCRNQLCVNPAHLEPVTQRENLLRGETVCAIAFRRTKCINGHAFTEANTYLWRGTRCCRTCRQARGREYRARQAS